MSGATAASATDTGAQRCLEPAAAARDQRLGARWLPEVLSSPSTAALLVAVTSAVSGRRAALARVTDGDQLELVEAVGVDAEDLFRWRQQPFAADSPLLEAMRAGRPVVRLGALVPGDLDTGCTVALPLVVGGRSLGAVGVEYAAARTIAWTGFATVARAAAEAFDRIEREAVLARARRLEKLTALLGALRSPRDIAHALVVEGIDAFGAVAGAVALVDRQAQTLSIQASRGYPVKVLKTFDQIPLDFPTAAGDTIRTGRAILLETPVEVDERYPEARAGRGSPSQHAVAVLPLAADGDPFGALSFQFRAPRMFGGDELAFLLAVSQLGAQALDRSLRLREHARTVRLQAVTSALMKALTQEDVGRVVVQEVMTALGARAGLVAVADPVSGRLVPVAAVGYPGGLVGRLADGDATAFPSISVAAALNEPVLAGSLAKADGDREGAAHEFLKIGHRAAAAYPLRLGDTVVGAMAFTWKKERRFFDEESDLLGAVAGVCAQALERVRLYELSERRRERLRRVLDHLGEAVIVVDDALQVTYANEDARRLFGGTILTGNPLPERWPELRLGDLTRSLLCMEAEPVSERSTLADGRTFEIVAAPEERGAMLVLRDVSRQERQERAEREFVANAAHELRTPLAAIATAADALERGAKDQAAERDFYIAGIVSEVGRLVRLSDALLLLARAQAEPGILRQERVELAPLVTEIAARLDVRPGVRVVVADVDAAVRGERALVEGVLANVARNASRHTSTGSIAFSCRRNGDSVVLEVADTGTGMSESVRSSATARFFRGGERDRAGFGLGLTIALEMVRALGGELEISSRRGVGTSVQITLEAA